MTFAEAVVVYPSLDSAMYTADREHVGPIEVGNGLVVPAQALVGQPRLVSGADGSIGIEKEPVATAPAY
jgi:hypothetical protein